MNLKREKFTILNPQKKREKTTVFLEKKINQDEELKRFQYTDNFLAIRISHS